MNRWFSLALALAAVTPVLGDLPSPGCGTATKLVTPDPAKTPLTIMINSKASQYYVKIPDNYQNAHPYRLIFAIHAPGGNAQQVTVGTGGYLPWYGLPALINDTAGAARRVSKPMCPVPVRGAKAYSR